MTTSKNLDTQDRVLDFWRKFQTVKGYPPTYDEVIAAGIGLSSTSAVAHVVAQLVEAGRLTKKGSGKRQIIVTGSTYTFA
jgi:SOS-response transcriptional repressor LexA